MRVKQTLCIVLVVLYGGEGATTGTACSTSYDCSVGSCCRDIQGKVVFHTDGSPPVSPLHFNGNCTTQKAQAGEMCDGHCQCIEGLTCFSPVSMFHERYRCYDEAKAKQQVAYWSKCKLQEAEPDCLDVFYYPKIIG